MRAPRDPDLTLHAKVSSFFDAKSNTISYILRDPDSDACAVIDVVMNFDYATGRLSLDAADAMIELIEANDLKLEWIIETHVYADHVSNAPYIHERLEGNIGIGEHIVTVHDTFDRVFNEGTDFQRNGSQFDALSRMVTDTKLTA